MTAVWNRSSLQRLQLLIGAGILILLVEVLFFYGHGLFLEVSTAKVTGDGDSLMASSSALERLRIKLEAESQHSWFIQNRAHNGYRMGIEVEKEQRERIFPYRLPWKNKDTIWVIGGTNDLGLGGPNRVERLLGAVENYFREQQRVGYSESRCFYTDILPRNTPGDPTFDIDRRRYNSLISKRLAGLAHVIPSGSNPLLADPLNVEIYTDGTHLTEAGNEIIAEDAFRTIREILRG
jgi:hypothetical protein